MTKKCARCGKELSKRRLSSGTDVVFCSRVCRKRHKRSTYQKRRMLVDDEVGRKIKATREKYAGGEQ